MTQNGNREEHREPTGEISSSSPAGTEPLVPSGFEHRDSTPLHPLDDGPGGIPTPGSAAGPEEDAGNPAGNPVQERQPDWSRDESGRFSSSIRIESILDLADLCDISGPSWETWRTALKAAFRIPMLPSDLEVFEKHTGRSSPPSSIDELWLIVGRRGGKSRIASLISVYLALFHTTYDLAPGETGTLLILSASKKQAKRIKDYISGILHSVPLLEKRISSETFESIILKNGIEITSVSASYRLARGGTCVGVVIDEIAFFYSDEMHRNPDHEILNAIRPSMATVQGAMLVAISSPYARKGSLWTTYQDHYGKDSSTLVWQATSIEMNPLVRRDVIDRAFAEDPSVAGAEYGGQFRSDLEQYISREAIEGCVEVARTVIPPDRKQVYQAFTDPSGGSGDSWTLAIAHTEEDRGIVLDFIGERKPPFSPESVATEFSAVLREYGVNLVTGDRYAGEFPRELFRKWGIGYDTSDRSKSQLYQEALPLLNSGRVELLDNERLIGQLLGLERRTTRAGKDSIDHGPNSHDDVANAVAGALVLASERLRKQVRLRKVQWG